MKTAALVNRLLCAHDGRMKLEDLYAQLSEVVLKDEVENVLKDTDMFVITGDEDKVVVVKTKLRLCRSKECQGCSNLHLCKRYLFGDCPYDKGRSGCRFCHDLCSEHNINVLHQHNLLELDRCELCVVLLQNDNTLLPPVCFSYNKGSGEYGNCPDKEACSRLHLCEKYIRGTCKGSTECRRCHDFYEPHPMKNLQSRGVCSHMMGSLLMAYKNMLTIWDSNSRRVNSSTSANAEKCEICLFYIKNYCKRGSRCQTVHFHLPYKWEERDGHGWKGLPNNEEIEKAFCNPAKTYSDSPIPVQFDTMTHDSAEVRRLSTVSSVLNPTFFFTTSWLWYWEDENGNWIQYGTPQETHHSSSITSEDLERKYQEDSNAKIEFTAGQQYYELNMQDMMQYNRQVGTHRPVRRRPVFLSAEDVQKIKTRGHSQNTKTLPSHWDKTFMSDTGFKRVLLNSTSEEYMKILELFNQTMSGFNVNSIERVQNRDLWEVFQWQSDVMSKKTAGKENEKLLFHGTESKHIDAICQQNFDWRICGVHGTAYGKGSYFAKDAKYSHSYTESGTRCMFVCRVLVGEYTKGDSNYARPPLKDGESTIFYDSCVNDIKNPSVFVVFEKHQVYPEYLIQYEEDVETSHEQVLVDDFSQMSFSSLDDQSVSHQLSTHSSFSSISSEESVEPIPGPISATVTGPPTFPKFPNIRYRTAFRSMSARSKTSSFISGPAHVPTHTHLSKPPSVKRSFNVKTKVRPQRQQKFPKRFSSVATPESVSADRKSLRSPNVKQDRSNLSTSAKDASPVTSSPNVPTKTTALKLVRSQSSARQDTRSTKDSVPSSAKLQTNSSSDIKTSVSVRIQNISQHLSNLTSSATGSNHVTLSVNLSTDTKTSLVRTQSARQQKSSLSKSAKDVCTINSSAQLAAHAKTSNTSGSQNSRQQKSSSARSAVSLSASLSVDTKTSTSSRGQNAREDRPSVARPSGGSSSTASSANLSTNTKTSKPVRAQNASQQKPGASKTSKGVNPVMSSASISGQSNTSKSVRSETVKTQRVTAPKPKTGASTQKGKSTFKGSKSSTARR